MKYYILTLLVTLAASPIYGTHLIGGDITYKRLEHNQNGFVKFEITLTILIDKNNSSVNLDDTMYLGVYDGRKKDLVRTLTVGISSIQEVGDYLCENTNQNVEKGQYKTEIVLPKNTDGYIITSERCCGGAANNVTLNSNGEPERSFYFVTEIPNTDIQNSSAIIQQYVKAYCDVTSDRWSFSGYDLDGDSIVISLNNISKGIGSLGQVASKPLPSEVFVEPKPIDLKAGFNYLKPFGLNFNTSLEENRLVIIESSYKVPAGYYFVSFEVKEFRNKVLLGSRNVEVTGYVLNCQQTSKMNTPVNLNVNKDEYLRPRLTWQGCSQAVKHFQIMRSAGDSINFTEIDTVSSTTSVYWDKGLKTHGKYFYQVVGVPYESNTSGKSNIDVANYFKSNVLSKTKNADLKIYPNPSSGAIHISSASEIISVQLRDVLGKTCFMKNYDSYNSEIIETIPSEPGFYTCIIETKDGFITQSILIYR